MHFTKWIHKRACEICLNTSMKTAHNKLKVALKSFGKLCTCVLKICEYSHKISRHVWLISKC